jgi:hypothetical protein
VKSKRVENILIKVAKFTQERNLAKEEKKHAKEEEIKALPMKKESTLLGGGGMKISRHTSVQQAARQPLNRLGTLTMEGPDRI